MRGTNSEPEYFCAAIGASGSGARQNKPAVCRTAAPRSPRQAAQGCLENVQRPVLDTSPRDALGGRARGKCRRGARGSRKFTVHKEELAAGATRDGAAPRHKELRLHTSHIRRENKTTARLRGSCAALFLKCRGGGRCLRCYWCELRLFCGGAVSHRHVIQCRPVVHVCAERLRPCLRVVRLLENS